MRSTRSSKPSHFWSKHRVCPVWTCPASTLPPSHQVSVVDRSTSTPQKSSPRSSTPRWRQTGPPSSWCGPNRSWRTWADGSTARQRSRVTGTLRASTFIGMSADSTAEQVSLIGAELIRRTEQLGAAVAAAVRDGIDFYRHTEVVSHDQLVESCIANVRFIFSGLAGPQSFDTTPATSTGESRAQSRVPLPVVMAAYRVGSHVIWQALLDIVEAHSEISRHALLAVTERIWEAQDVYTDAMTTGYRRRATQQAIDDETERAALTEALFTGTVSAGHSPWEIADLLGLPT